MVEMIYLTHNNLAKWTSGNWKKITTSGNIVGVSQDSRKILPGMLYIALEGKNYNGHDFITEAFQKGAIAAVVSDSYRGKENDLLLVKEPLEALQQIACEYRKLWNGRLVGVTGSVGKTTVKDLCSAILGDQTHKSLGNYNNHIGVPLSLLSINDHYNYSIIEIGMSKPGEIKKLSRMASPEIGIITDLGLAHREYFENMEQIVDEKAELLRVLPKNGLAILMKNEKWYYELIKQTDAEIVDIGIDIDSKIQGSYQNGILNIEGYDYRLPKPGFHMAKNLLRAVTLGLVLGKNHNEMIEGLSSYVSAPMRWDEKIINGVNWINDAYNANPSSMRASLMTLKENYSESRYAVIGEMFELGDIAEIEHVKLADYIDQLELEGWIVLGSHGELMVKGRSGIYVESIEQAVDQLNKWIVSGDSVLIKGSRGTAMERILNFY